MSLCHKVGREAGPGTGTSLIYFISESDEERPGLCPWLGKDCPGKEDGMEEMTLAGIDVARKTLEVCLENSQLEARKFSNDRQGHQALIQRLSRGRGRARVVLEATGVYHMDLALALHRAARVEVMVVNPRAAKDFAQASMRRSKTDVIDAEVLLEYVRRMPFQAWIPPSAEELELRTLGRRIGALTKDRTKEKNRLHAARYLSEIVHHDIDLNVRHLGRRIKGLRAQALKMISKTPGLRRRLDRLTSIRGIGTASAIQILAELLVLPKDMTPRQWVAHAGLDPRIVQSGLSIHAPARISRMGNRHLRGALFLPALVAIRFEPNVKAFYEKLLAKQKAKMQAIVAVMRKLLHAIHGMLRTETDFDGEKFYALGR